MKIPASWVLASVFLAASACVAAARGQDTLKPNNRSDFMRQKLEFSKNVLEGLAREDFDLIAKNARGLKSLSMAAEWELPTIPNAEEYVAFTGEFQRAADDLVKKAKGRNLDGATLAFNRMTVNCVDCHRYVRGVAR